MVVDEGGGTSRLEYDAFGVLRRDESGGEVRYTYTGQETETALASAGKGGLMNYGARMYDPYLGRFLSVDPAGQFHSPYTYAGNNPVRMVDPNGRFAFTAVAIGMGIAAASYSAAAIGTGTGLIEGDASRFAPTTKFMGAVGVGGASGALSSGVGAASAIGISNTAAAGAVNGAASGALTSATRYSTTQLLTGEKFDAGDFFEQTGAGFAGGAVSGGISQHLGGALQGFADNGGAQFALARAVTGGTASASSAAMKALVKGDALANKSFSIPVGQGSVSLGFDTFTEGPDWKSIGKSAVDGVAVPYGVGLVDKEVLIPAFGSGSASFDWGTLQYQFEGRYATRLSTLFGGHPVAPATLNQSKPQPVSDFFGTPSFNSRSAMVGEVTGTMREKALDYAMQNRPYSTGLAAGAVWMRLHQRALFRWEQPGSATAQ